MVGNPCIPAPVARPVGPSTSALQELLPIVLACALWGQQWAGSLVLCHSDNTAVVSQVNRLHARDPLAGHMLRCLAFFQALYDCRLRAVHIPSATNRSADLLSRNRTSGEINRSLHSPTQVPPDLVSLLCLQTPNWTSQCWWDPFCTFWRQASPPQPERYMLPDGLRGPGPSPMCDLFIDIRNQLNPSGKGQGSRSLTGQVPDAINTRPMFLAKVAGSLGVTLRYGRCGLDGTLFIVVHHNMMACPRSYSRI